MPRKFHHRRPLHAARKTRLALKLLPSAVALSLLLAVFGAGYLIQINVASSKGFQIRSLEREISDLKDQSERLELKVAQEQSVRAVETKVQNMGMIPTPKVEYVAVTQLSVAQR